MTETLDQTAGDTADEAAAEVEDLLDVPLAPLRPALEAVLMVADQPLDESTLASAVGHPVAEVREALAALVAEYDEAGRGFELRNVAGGWRYYTREELAPVVERFVLDGQQARLTQAALETLAVVAYQQPVSRSRVSAVRGVNVDGVMRTLLTRGLVEEAGNDAESGAHLYRTTSYFLERIGVTSIEELPELAPFLPELEDMEAELLAQEVSTGSTAEQGVSTGSTGEQEVSTGSTGEGGSTDEVGSTDGDEGRE